MEHICYSLPYYYMNDYEIRVNPVHQVVLKIMHPRSEQNLYENIAHFHI